MNVKENKSEEESVDVNIGEEDLKELRNKKSKSDILESEGERTDNNEKEDRSDFNSNTFQLISQVKKSKMVKSKESRNSDIKESKNNLENDSDNKKFYGIQDDVDLHMKKNTLKLSGNEKRSDNRNTYLKVSKSSESYKEDIILGPVLDTTLEEEKVDPQNITGSQSLDLNKINTPDKIKNIDSDKTSSSKTDYLVNSDSKYVTVSILSELSKKAEEKEKEDAIPENLVNDTTLETTIEEGNGNKLADLIYSAMLAEIKAELFPPRPLFLLTADLEKIELEQAMIYLNDMSVEKEAALLKEYLKYSGSEDIDFSEWENEGEKKIDEETNKFNGSGSLVLYEQKGISTDLFSIETYVDELAEEVDLKKRKHKFLTDTFTPIKKNSIKVLNQLQNSDIGSYEHFETDLNSIAILPLEVYLELEKKRKHKEIEEPKSDSSDDNMLEDQNISKEQKVKKEKEKNLLKE